MHTKKYLILNFERLVCHFKSIGILFFVPLFIVNLFIPIVNLLCFLKYGVGDYLFNNIMNFTQMFIPMFSIWWLLFILREYIESDGNELLYVCKNKNKFFDSFNIFLIYIFDVAILYAVYTRLFPIMIYEFLKIVCICIFYFGATFFLIFLTKSITITLMVDLLYTLANIIFYEYRGSLPLYYVSEPASFELFKNIFIPLAIIGIVLLIFGMIINKKKLKVT